MLPKVAMKHTQSCFVSSRKVFANFQLKKMKIAEIYEVIFVRLQLTFPKFWKYAQRHLYDSPLCLLAAINTLKITPASLDSTLYLWMYSGNDSVESCLDPTEGTDKCLDEANDELEINGARRWELLDCCKDSVNFSAKPLI